MPVVLGNLLPLVDTLPPVTPLGTFYNLQPPFLRSLPPALERLVVCHFHFEKYDQQHRFAATHFHSNLQLVRAIAGQIAEYLSSPALSDEDRSNLTRMHGSVLERCDSSFMQVQQNYQFRASEFNQIVAMFSGGAYDTIGEYGTAEYQELCDLWIRYIPAPSYLA